MTQTEALKMALEALENTSPIGLNMESDKRFYAAIAAIKEALAQPEQEPVAFEEWLSKQHGDPEEIGFLQALRIAYISGQDSIATPPQRKTFNHHEFGYWWFEYGSGLFPLEGEDQEEHAYRVANAAWQAAHGIKGD